MIPVFQTIVGPGGNCLSACLASILEIDIAGVPNFCAVDHENWLLDCAKWLRDRFYLWPIMFSVTDDDAGERTKEYLAISGGYYLAGVKSERGLKHQVVYRNGKLAHDPYPGGGQIIGEPFDYMVFWKLDAVPSP
jgi:hypothetical protein